MASPLPDDGKRVVERAAAWVCDSWPELSGGDATSDEVRVALAVLASAICQACDAQEPRLVDYPWTTPAAPLLRAVRTRLLDRDAARELALDPAVTLRLMRAIERVHDVADRDSAQRFIEHLSAPNALQLLVEVAHDIRSPLGSILFLVERLRNAQSGPITPIQERQLGLVYSAAFGLSSLASDVMELARGGDRLVSNQPVPFSVSEVLQSVRDIVTPIAEEKGLVTKFSGPSVDVRSGHPAALNRVLLNLATNALKFTAKGSVEVRIEQLSRSRVRCVVEDTGRGIPPHVMETLFDAFRRREQPKDYTFSSAGLGLAICRTLVTAMGGELQVDSELEQGTKFHFELELPPSSRW